MNKDKLVSWLIPVSHSEISLLRCLNSIKDQTYSNWEAIIVFNNLKNKNEYSEIIKIFKDDDRYHFHYTAQKGITRALNYGLRISNGEFIARLDADDFAVKDRLKKQISYTSYDFIFSNVIYLNEKEKIIGKSNISSNYLLKYSYTNQIPHPSILIRKEILIKVGGYDGYEVCQDLRTWEKLIKKDCKFFLINDHLTYTTIRKNRITGSKESRYQAAKFYLKKFKSDKTLLSLIAYIRNIYKYYI